MKKLNSVLLFAAVFLFSFCSEKKDEIVLLPISQAALSDTSSVFYTDFEELKGDVSTLPIGVFDSGTGGLTVLEKFLTLDTFDNITGNFDSDGILDFAGEKFIYLADDANMPYGDYKSLGKADFLRELIVKDALFLLGNRFFINPIDDTKNGIKERVKIIVIACNTATAYGLEDVQQLLEQSDSKVKVIGVINAGVKALLDRLDKNETNCVGVLATPGTISSGAYEREILRLCRERGFKNKVNVINQSGSGFADAVDGKEEIVSKDASSVRDSYKGPKVGNKPGDINLKLMSLYNFDKSNNRLLYTVKNGRYVDVQLNSAANYARFHLVSLIDNFRRNFPDEELKSVILGCTHYPFLINTLEEVIVEMRKNGYNIAKDFFFIDPAQYTAQECYSLLREDNNLALSLKRTKVTGYISVPSIDVKYSDLEINGSLKREYKYGRVSELNFLSTKFVPFSDRYIDDETTMRIETLLPVSYSYIKNSL